MFEEITHEKTKIINSKLAQIPDDIQFFEIANMCKSTCAESSGRISFNDYKVLRNKVIPIAKRYFISSTFLKMPKDIHGSYHILLF
jgi:hypothetical protein